MNKQAPEILLYTPAIALEQLLNRRWQKAIASAFILSGTIAAGGYIYSTYISPSSLAQTFLGIGAISTSFLVTMSLLRFFHNAFYYRGFATNERDKKWTTYEVARIFYNAQGDVTESFVRSPQGYETTKRLGLTDDAIEQFLHSARTKLPVSSLVLPEDQFFTFRDLGLVLYETDSFLKKALQEQGVTDDIFLNTLSWVTRRYYTYKNEKRWWSKDNLSKMTGIGREWSYGTAYLLNRFSREITTNSIFSNLISDNSYTSEKIEDVEQVLSRSRESNIILVGEPGVGKMDILLRVAERIKRKISHTNLQDRRFIILDTERMLAQFDTKQELERTMITMLNQAQKAGNVILVIENISRFIRAGESVSVDIESLIEPYLDAPELHIVFTETPNSYHHEVETLPIMQKIETLYIDPPSLLGTERILEDITRRYEIKYNTILTYPGLQAIAVDADRYIPTGVMPDKAIDLLVEVLGAASQTNTTHVTEDFVQSYVQKKTGIPVGPINDTEREMLLSLEDTLHERVVGQDVAISAISSAMRRARAGIQDTDRPMGSFLFLGPTGVGKTETAKALASVFFGSEDAMLRIDMSEFSGSDALERLLGNDDISGIISDMMQEHPYAVLLLDEFEKATKEVHDLFLQILDEGRLTDGRGDIINMRNTLIIATSNAGSQFIIEAVRDNKNLNDIKENIIGEIIRDQMYRPELINRFDGVILFEPLGHKEQKTIAGYLMNELQKRIEQKGYTVVFDDTLTQLVAEEGYNPEFGARPMRRVIQDQIEEAVARKIIAGSLKKGGTIHLSAADIITQ